MQLLRIIFLKIRRIFAEILVFTKAAPICRKLLSLTYLSVAVLSKFLCKLIHLYLTVTISP